MNVLYAYGLAEARALYVIAKQVVKECERSLTKRFVVVTTKQVAKRARDAAKSKVDRRWKDLIEGTAQKTKTDGHQARSYREAIEMAKSGIYDKVRLNRAYSTTTGVGTSPRRLPDVIGVRKDGRVDVVEVPSRSDNIVNLIQRNQDAMQQLPEHMRGDVRIAPIR